MVAEWPVAGVMAMPGPDQLTEVAPVVITVDTNEDPRQAVDGSVALTLI